MSFWDYKYGGTPVRDRFDYMMGKHAGPIEWVIRLAVIAFAMRTMADPTEHIYMHPMCWVVIVALIFFS